MELFECSALERDLRVLAADLDALKNATAGQIDNAVLDLQDRVRRILTDIRGTAISVPRSWSTGVNLQAVSLRIQ